MKYIVGAKKAVLGGILLMILCFGTSAYAHTLDVPKFNPETFMLTVSGSVVIDPLKDMNDVTLQVLKRGEDFKSITDGDFSNYYQNIAQISISEDGRYSYSYRVESTPGNHNLRIVFADGTVLKSNFIYGSADENEKFVEAINAADSVEKMKAVISSYSYFFEDFALDDEISKKFPNVDVAGETLKPLLGKKYAKMEDFISEYKAETATLYINLSNTSLEIKEIIDKNSAIMGLDDNVVYKNIYSKLKDVQKQSVCGTIVGKSFARFQETEKTFSEQIILWSVNNSENWMDMNNIIINSGEYLNPANSKYLNLISEERIYVDKNIAKIKHNSFLELKKCFEKLVANPSDGGSGGGSGGSGGSGGGSGNTGGGSDDAITIKPEINRFNDLGDVAWAITAINSLAEKNIINGNGSGLFMPNDSVKREEFVKMIVIAFNLSDKNGSCDFLDVDESDWCYTYIAAAVNSGIINGIEENKFGIGDTITREDMATILYRTAKKIGNERLDSEIKTKFSDHEEISDYAIDGIYAMKNLNIING
ncbi:MAG: S-layer homology domain-containing protein, partial [Oscillospiraceae bacterium]